MELRNSKFLIPFFSKIPPLGTNMEASVFFYKTAARKLPGIKILPVGVGWVTLRSKHESMRELVSVLRPWVTLRSKHETMRHTSSWLGNLNLCQPGNQVGAPAISGFCWVTTKPFYGYDTDLNLWQQVLGFRFPNHLMEH